MASMDKDPEIVIAEANESFYLVAGEEHLDTMLESDTGYPLPVGIIRFPSMSAFIKECGPEMPVQSLWQVNPKIIARLRQDEHVVEIVAPA